MRDYVSREEVMKVLAEIYAFYGKEVRLPHERVCLMNDIDTPRTAIEYAEKEVLAIPPADVAPVVRCRDCFHYRESPWEKEMVCRCHSDFLYTGPEDFCSSFVKREHKEPKNFK